MEYSRWTAQVKTFFAKSNLQYTPYQEQIGYLHMCLDVSVTAEGDTPIMMYEDEDNDEETCLHIIDAEFIKWYPIPTRRHTAEATTRTTTHHVYQQHAGPGA